MLTTGLSDDHLVTLVGVNRKWILEDYSQISSLLGEEMVRVHQEIQDAIQSIDPVAEYQYYAQSHKYFTSSTHSTRPVLNLQYQFYPYCTSITDGFRFSIPKKHVQTLFLISIETQE